MLRHARRHISASVKKYIEEALDELEWEALDVKINSGGSQYLKKISSADRTNHIVVITVGGQYDDADTEVGGINREVYMELVVDVLGKTASRTTALAGDIFDILAARNTSSFIPLYDFSDPDLEETVDRLEIEDPFEGYPDNDRGDWIQIGANLVYSYQSAF